MRYVPRCAARNARGRRRRGAAAVEAALVLPVLFLFLFAILEFVRYIALRQVANNAVREGARFAVVRVVDGGTTDFEVKREVDRKLAGFGAQLTSYSPEQNIHIFRFKPSNPSVRSDSWKDAGFGEYIAVEFEGTYDSLFSTLYLPGVGDIEILGDHHFQARAVMYSEAN